MSGWVAVAGAGSRGRRQLPASPATATARTGRASGRGARDGSRSAGPPAALPRHRDAFPASEGVRSTPAGGPGSGPGDRDVVADERAGAHARGQEALAGQAVVGDGDRRPRDRQPSRQLAGRRQPIAWPEHAGDDRLAELTVDLPGHGRRRPTRLTWRSTCPTVIGLVACPWIGSSTGPTIVLTLGVLPPTVRTVCSSTRKVAMGRPRLSARAGIAAAAIAAMVALRPAPSRPMTA